MHREIIKNSNGSLHLSVCNTKATHDRENAVQMVQNILSDIEENDQIGYAGFIKKQYLREALISQMFDKDQLESTFQYYSLPLKQLSSDIENFFALISQKLSYKEDDHIFIFPTYSEFINQKMNGVAGFTPYKHTILLFIADTEIYSSDTLGRSFAHEYVHALSRSFHNWTTLGDSFVFEGLAENFVAELFGEPPSQWSQAVSAADALQYFDELKSDLDATDREYEIFFENKKYPLWTGYTIGYHLIKEYRLQNPELTWRDLIEQSPTHILKNIKMSRV